MALRARKVSGAFEKRAPDPRKTVREPKPAEEERNRGESRGQWVLINTWAIFFQYGRKMKDDFCCNFPSCIQYFRRLNGIRGL